MVARAAIAAVTRSLTGPVRSTRLITTSPARTGQAAVLGGGAALFLAGDVVIRRVLRTGPLRLRVAAAIAALATTVVGLAAGLGVQLVLVAAVLIAPLVVEARPGGGELTPGDAAG